MRDAIALAGLRSHVNVAAFLRVIRVGEGTNDEDGYRRIFAGELFNGWADHPRKTVTARLGGKPITSTAAGAYQFLSRTWDECAVALGLNDFSPHSQDLAALFLIERRKALDDVIAGRIEQAIAKCNREWASLPGSPYGQPVKTMAQALETYRRNGGLFAIVPPTATPQPDEWDTVPFDQTTPPRATFNIPVDPINAPQGEPMAPFIAAAIPALLQAAPDLIRIFGDSPQSEKNAKAAELVAGIATAATGTKNVQEAVEAIESDPAQAQAYREAVKDRYYELSEVGGGVEAARKADAAVMLNAGPWWQVFRSPSFWIALVLLPLVYLVVGSVIGLWGGQWSDGSRDSIAGLVVGGIIGALTGYYFGQTTSRNRA
jgi:muramidase (phage lysozyme)